MNDLNNTLSQAINQEDWDRYMTWCIKNDTHPDLSDFARYLDEV